MKFRLVTRTGSVKVYSYITASDAEAAAGSALRIVDYIEHNSIANDAAPISLVNLATKEEFL